MYSMNNVLNSALQATTGKDAKSVLDELLKLSTVELTTNTAKILNELLKGILVMKVTDEGDADINIKLSSEQIKYILLELSNNL